MSATYPRAIEVPAAVFDLRRLAAVARTGLLDTGPDESFDRLTRLAATLLGTPFAFVTVVDAQRSYWKSCIGVASEDPADRQVPVAESFCRHVIGTGQELIIPDARTDPRTALHPSIASMDVGAWAGFPIKSPDGYVLGTFCALDTVARQWTPHDVEVLATLSQAAAGEIALREAIDDARAATRRAENATIRAEEAASQAELLASTLQESLLPPLLPQVPGVEIAVRYRRGGGGVDVLGDFYDVFPSVRNAWAVVVGDVSGKGPMAAKTTALARYTLRAAAVRSAAPHANLSTLNTALLNWFDEANGQFLTCVYATLRPHPQGLVVTVSCAGHDSAIIRRADGQTETLGRPGMLLGVAAQPPLHDQRALLRPGDSLLLFTDGVTEGHRAASRRPMFGYHRLREAVAGTAVASADQLAGAVDDAVLAFTEGHTSDDTAIVALYVPTDPS